MARSLITRIKELSAVWTLVGWVILAAGSGTILIAVGSHNDDDKSHPDLQQRVELLAQKADLIQKANDKKFEQIDKKQDRMILLLDNLTVKVDAL